MYVQQPGYRSFYEPPSWTKDPVSYYLNNQMLYYPSARTLEPLGQLSSEKHIGQLAVAIGKTAAVALLAVEVVETDLATKVGH